MSIKEIIQQLRVTMDDAKGQDSHFDSWLTQNEGICKAIDALKILDTQPVAQRPWVELTEQDMPSGEDPMFDHRYFTAGMVYAATVLKEKNR